VGDLLAVTKDEDKLITRENVAADPAGLREQVRFWWRYTFKLFCWPQRSMLLALLASYRI
jgi:hypothetical protein